jgi:hypothetical protein
MSLGHFHITAAREKIVQDKMSNFELISFMNHCLHFLVVTFPVEKPPWKIDTVSLQDFLAAKKCEELERHNERAKANNEMLINSAGPFQISGPPSFESLPNITERI